MSARSVVFSLMIMVQIMLKTGPWNLSELKEIDSNGYKVMSCFHCGGGSTMGYKLSGYEVLGGVEIDPKMMNLYKTNHNPKYSFLMGVQDFNKLSKDEIPNEFFNLDILDGSPPCSSFSMAGSREKAWGKNKKFREGQAVQVLDDLFFHFIETARILQPKVVIAENVKGLIHGNAKGYVVEIAKMFKHAGYSLQLFVLNSAFMGVPQQRERTFFVARRDSFKVPKIELNFNEKTVSVKQAFDGTNKNGKMLNEKVAKWWKETKKGGLFSVCGANTGKMNRKLDDKRPAWTVTATPNAYHYDEPRHLSKSECIRLQSFPDDFNFLKEKPNYVCGMSVPPYMMNRISKQIQLQWLDKQ